MTNRPSWGAVLVAVAVPVVTIVLLIAAYTVQILRSTGDVAVPSASASPVQVVEAFIDALNEHDCSTAAALWTGINADDGSDWCRSVEHVDATNIGVVNANSTPTEIEVGSQISVDERLIFSDDSLPPGQFFWGWDVTREHNGWRIDDDGVP